MMQVSSYLNGIAAVDLSNLMHRKVLNKSETVHCHFLCLCITCTYKVSIAISCDRDQFSDFSFSPSHTQTALAQTQSCAAFLPVGTHRYATACRKVPTVKNKRKYTSIKEKSSVRADHQDVGVGLKVIHP